MTNLPTQTELLNALQQSAAVIQRQEKALAAYREPIAIIGMACAFPGGADSPETFWRNLLAGLDAIRDLPPGRAADIRRNGGERETMPRQAGFLERVDSFDAFFFGLSPREVEVMDPAHRLLLETTWQALEDANLIPDELFNQEIGVFVGGGISEYLQRDGGAGHDLYAVTGNVASTAAGRVSYLLGLTGPCLAVDTSCSASLTAIHLACQSLRNGECSAAVAGGVNLILDEADTAIFADSQMLAPDARCKTFDDSANGYVRGEGCGLLVLKPLSAAQSAGDRILAVIRGTAINQDGPSGGLTVPNGPSQERVIRRALKDARLKPEQIGYVEAHGTGTPLGDPIEIGALSAVFQARSAPLYVGSAKTNVGHLEFAAGVAGVMKAVLALQHRTIPPHLNLKTPNRRIDWASAPVRVPVEATPWLLTDPSAQRLAGVSSFGFSGTNGHVIVGEAPRAEEEKGGREEGEEGKRGELFVLSAKSEAALRAYAARYGEFLAGQAEVNLADLCYTAQTGRSHFPHRLGVAAASVEALQEKLRAFAQDTGDRAADSPVGEAPPIAFLFTGQGAQYAGMGRELYDAEPNFRSALDECDALLRPLLGESILSVMGVGSSPIPTPQSPLPNPLDNTAYTQPALFALEYALAQVWQSWGVQPNLLIGHSIGELAAACVAGVFGLEDGLKLVAARGRLMAALPQDGEMLSLLASEEEARTAIAPYAADVSIAAVNAPRSVVISGRREAVLAIGEELAGQGVKTRRLTVSHAFHSPLMEPMLADFRRVAESISYQPPKLRLVSNLTGQLAGPEIATPGYWVRHVREAVRFADGVQTLAAEGCRLFVEIGPKSTLLGLTGQVLDSGTGDRGLGTGPIPNPQSPIPNPLLLPSLREGQPDRQQMLASLGELYTRGIAIDWAALHGDAPRRKIALPTYPFQRQRYWVDAPKSGAGQSGGLRPLIDHKMQLPRQRQTIFEKEFSLDSLPFLADYHIYGQAVVPGACHLALALSCAEILLDGAPARLEDVIFTQALTLLPDERRTVQLVAESLEQPGSFKFEIHSFDPAEADAEPVLHASGRLSRNRTDAPTLDLAQLQDECQQPLGPEALYAELAEQEIELGPTFRWLAALWQGGEKSALGHFSLPDAVSSVRGYALYPSLIDACFQLTAATTAGQDGGDTRLPFAVESLSLYASAADDSLRAYIRPDGEDRWQITLLSAQGQVIAHISGFQLRAASAAAVQGNRVRADWLHHLAWTPAPLRAAPQTDAPDRWLLFGGDDSTSRALAATLAADGKPVTVVSAGSTLSLPPVEAASGASQAVVAPANPAHFHQLLAQAIPDGQRLGVVYLWGAEASFGHLPFDRLRTPPAPEQAHQLATGLLHLAQALEAGQRVARLWIVTADCHAPIPRRQDRTEVHAPAAAASALWGLGRTLAQEMPRLGWTAVDLDGDDPAAQAQILAGELTGTAAPAAPWAGQVAWRYGLRYTARLERWSAPAPAKEFALSPEASYLVTGGLGGLGLETAQQLIDDGARHLVLSGRSGAKSEAAQAALARWREAGIHVQVVQADMARREDVERLLAACDALSPLAGIVHAAGVLDDGVVAEQSAERFERVMRPKAAGAWHLHCLTAERELDFFVCFSSAASLLGSAGQSNYATANAFLDGLMAQRRAAGLPGCAVQWGPWAEVGMAANLTQRMAAQGMGMIAPAQGRAILRLLLVDAPAQVGVVPARLSPLGEIVAQADSLPHTSQPQLGEALRAASPAERPGLLEAYLRQEIAHVLRLPAGMRIGPEDQFFKMGFDSLMAVELKNRIQTALGAPLRSTLIFEHPTLAGMVAHLAGENGGGENKEEMLPLVKVDQSRPIPLSFAQQRLWFNQTSNRTNSYNIIAPFRLAGRLDVTALEQSLTELQTRHAVLRTTFPTVDGEAVQVIGEAGPVRIIRREMPGLSAEEQAAASEQIIQNEVEHLYDLAEGPLWRVVLVQFDEASHLLLFSFNHILIDAASLGQILKELGLLYGGYGGGAPVHLPELAYRYVDYAQWQRRTLTPEIVAQRVQHWVTRLSRETPLFELHGNYPRPAKESFRGAAFPLEISPAQTSRMQELQKETGATLFSTLLAAWTGLIWRYGKHNELVVGSPFYNRPHDELAGVAGHWGSMLLLPLQFTPEMSFVELVQQVNQRRQESIANDVPIDQLVPALPPARKRNNLPHQIFFSFLPGRESKGLNLAGVEATSLEKSSVMLRPDMALTAWEEPGPAGLQVQGSWEYKVELFDGGYVHEMIADFYVLLEGALADPNCPIHRLPLPHRERVAAQVETV